jgi:PPM family protein phosphatase
MKGIRRMLKKRGVDDMNDAGEKNSEAAQSAVENPAGTAPLGGGLEGATRPLPSEEAPSLVSEHLIFAQASDVGIARQINQDSALSFFATLSSVENRPDFGIFIIADGMGGHHDGERASAVAARTVMIELMRHVYTLMLLDAPDRPPVTEALNDAIIRANTEVINQVPEGGTTLTAAVIVGDLAYIGHVGDSRAYLIHKGIPEQLTRDHSYVQRLYELGQLDQSEVENHLQKNVLYKALGQPDLTEVEVMTRRLPANSTLLICCDGLWGQVRDHEITRIVNENGDLRTACAELIAAANKAGGIDNVSTIIVRIPA